jgi:hypothetical protein
MKLSIFDKDNPNRSIMLSVLVLFGLGYVFYFLARWLPQPQWTYDLMLWLSPSVGGLARAEQVAKHLGNDPFPAQVVILYGAFGSIPWAAWFSYLFWRNKKYLAEEISKKYQGMPTKKRPSQLRIWLTATALLVIGYGLYKFCFFTVLGTPTWRDALFYSNSFSSYLFMTVVMFVVSLAIPAAFILIYSIFKFEGLSKCLIQTPQKN